jgi:radical S-adenosyl methionine domain-containing protein 2
VVGYLPLASAQQLLKLLAESGVEKLNFAGGEPTLHPHIGTMLRQARELGFVTSMVTNGSRLRQVLDQQAEDLDWVGLSVDSALEETEVALGRSRGGYIARSIDLAHRARESGVRVKLNTVVTALNWQEDLTPLVREVRPERWKVFQVLPMGGQNDGVVGPLLISAEQFKAFVQRHKHLGVEGFAPIVEDNDAMRGSYAMIDPLGRFYGNATGRHVYSRPILEVGVSAALSEVGYEDSKFDARGGKYAW